METKTEIKLSKRDLRRMEAIVRNFRGLKSAEREWVMARLTADQKKS